MLCLEVPPAPVYKGARGEGAAGLGRRRAKGGVLLPPGVGLLLSLLEYKRRKEEEREKEKGGAVLLPVGVGLLRRASS